MADLARLLPPLLHGAAVTAGITVVSTLLGAVLAFIAGFGRLSKNRLLRYPANVYVEIFRGTSLLVQLFWLFFALPLLGINLSPLSAGILGLGLNIGAYGAEVVRGAMQAVPRGQLEAARALNFNPLQILLRVQLPQALPEMMPPFGNLAVQNLKDSALVSLITLADLTFRAEDLRNRTLETTPILTLTLFIYFGMALIISYGMRRLERHVVHASGRTA